MACVICWTHFLPLMMCLICSTEQLSGVEPWLEVEWPVWLSLTLPSNSHVLSMKHTSLEWWWCAITETNNTMRIANQILNMDIFFIITMQRYPFYFATRLQRLIFYLFFFYAWFVILLLSKCKYIGKIHVQRKDERGMCPYQDRDSMSTHLGVYLDTILFQTQSSKIWKGKLYEQTPLSNSFI